MEMVRIVALDIALEEIHPTVFVTSFALARAHSVPSRMRAIIPVAAGIMAVVLAVKGI